MLLARARSKLTERADEAVFPGTQGGPLMHVVAAKAVAFAEALEPEFTEYQRAHARERALARGRARRARLSDRLGRHGQPHAARRPARQEDRRAARRARARGGTDRGEPRVAAGRERLGADAGQRRASGSARRPSRRAASARPRFARSAAAIADILDANGADAAVSRVRGTVLELCAAFPVYGPRARGAREVAPCTARSAASRTRK